jgi:sugar lactone lactonase YvrE
MHPFKVLVAGAVLLLLSASAAFAEAEDSDPQSAPSLAQIETAMEDPGASIVAMPHTDPQAAEELPHQDLDREQANELLTGVFGSAFQNPAEIFDELSVKEFYSDNVAVVAPEGEPSGEGASEPAASLLESTVPLRVEDSSGQNALLDLGLENTEGELQPSSPLVEVGIPTQLDDGFSLPESGVEIKLAGAPAGRAPSTPEPGIATYPNVAEDTLLAAIPTPTGLETLTLLQSVDAPTSQTFDLTLPAGATLQETKAGGAEIRRDDQTLVVVYPPTALDANGEAVPVRLEVAGDTLTLVAEPTSSNVAPILVDPVFESYGWRQGTSSLSDIDVNWRGFSNNREFWTQTNGSCPGCPSEGVRGLGLVSGVGWAPAMSQARWDYHVPRWGTDYADPAIKARPTTYIKKATLWNLYFDATSGLVTPVTPDPFMEFYLWDEYSGFVALGKRLGTEGNLTDMNYQYNLVNPNENVNAKQLSLELVQTQNQYSQYRQLYVGSVTMELTDKDRPAFGSLGSPSPWMNNQPTGSISFSASDPGLGISQINIANPRPASTPLVTENKRGCIGTNASPCPRAWSSSNINDPKLLWDPKVMPQGENWVVVNPHDPTGKTTADGGSPAEVRIKVDHTAPSLRLSGTLTEQEKVGRQAEYTLKYDASDGFDATPSALVPINPPTEAGDPKLTRPLGVAADGQGHVWMVDRENKHVVEFDEEGKYLGQFGSYGTANGQFLDPRGIAVSPNGTIWVADAARGRIQQFNAKGEYLQGFGAKVSAPNSDPYSFVEPWGVAIAPNGRLWVSDAGGGRIALFNEQYVVGGPERFVLNAVGTPSSSTAKAELVAPVGIATDAGGNVWVAENGAHRVSVFDSSGKFRMRFGSEGSGNGQFKFPVGVAITPTGHVLVTDQVNNRVQEFMSSGAYIRQFGSGGTANNQFQEPKGIAVGAGNVAFVSDAGNHRVTRWTGADLDPQSGVASTEVKIDGNPVEPKYAPGCATKNCSISREWKLYASDYSSGQHQVQVVATDGVGLTTTKELTITTDNTVPQLKSISSYFLTPKGWLEQKTYSYSTSFADAGYGITSIAYKIDGKVVNSVNQSCPNGGCSATLSGSINMASYPGGAHAAELLATDAAGNVKTFTKTINVDPKGSIPVAESVDTLEAMEKTSPTNAVGESQEEEVIGSASGLGFEEQEGKISATGTDVPLEVADSPDDGFTVEVLKDPEAEDPEEEEFGEVIPIMIEPVQTSEGATPTTIVDGNASVASNTANHVDTIVKPLMDGGMTFQNIRDTLGPENYAWEVQLYPEQQLKAIDGLHAGVYEEEHLLFSINAVAAHDAVGTSVPTKLSVTAGSIVTLTVEHHASAFIYPVIAGAGWEGGFQTYVADMPPIESAGEGEGEGSGEGLMDTYSVVSPPEPVGDSDPFDATASKVQSYVKKYGYYGCATIIEGGCPTWKHKIKGFFFFNGRYAWWKDRVPVCESQHIPAGYTITTIYCDWIGPNHQPYGNGYHITSQTRFDVTEGVGSISQTDSHALTVRMFGSGTWKGHGNADVCNPSRPDC